MDQAARYSNQERTSSLWSQPYLSLKDFWPSSGDHQRPQFIHKCQACSSLWRGLEGHQIRDEETWVPLLILRAMGLRTLALKEGLWEGLKHNSYLTSFWEAHPKGIVGNPKASCGNHHTKGTSQPLSPLWAQPGLWGCIFQLKI